MSPTTTFRRTKVISPGVFSDLKFPRRTSRPDGIHQRRGAVGMFMRMRFLKAQPTPSTRQLSETRATSAPPMSRRM